jgi:hypothetical protein
MVIKPKPGQEREYHDWYSTCPWLGCCDAFDQDSMSAVFYEEIGP